MHHFSLVVVGHLHWINGSNRLHFEPHLLQVARRKLGLQEGDTVGGHVALLCPGLRVLCQGIQRHFRRAHRGFAAIDGGAIAAKGMPRLDASKSDDRLEDIKRFGVRLKLLTRVVEVFLFSGSREILIRVAAAHEVREPRGVVVTPVVQFLPQL